VAFTERSEATRAAILRAARRLLAACGYEAMTIRAVAAEADIDPSMVMRYYGNKDGLFVAAVDVDLHLPDPSTLDRSRIGEALAAHVISRWEGDLSDEIIALLLRSASTNPTAAEQLRRVFDEQILAFVRAVAGDDILVRRRAAMLSTQVLGLAYSRYIVGLPPIVEMNTDTLVAILGPVLQHYLTGDLDAAPDRGDSTYPEPSCGG
jgi:AcrR family transcriptional regulator